MSRRLDQDQPPPTEKLNLGTSLNPLEYIYLPSIYSRVIAPGAKKPFEFNMLSDVEEQFQFDITRKPSSYTWLYNKKKKKVKLSFWKLLRMFGRLWLLEEISLLGFRSFGILTAVRTRSMLDSLGTDEIEEYVLWAEFGLLMGSMILQSLFQTNLLTFCNLQQACFENVVKVSDKGILFHIYQDLISHISRKNF